MAGDWLKMEASTPDKPEVLAITVRMGWDDPDLTVGKLFRVWRWFDQHTTEGNAHGVTAALLDRIAGVTGFADAMQSVGWLIINADGLALPGFAKHNGATAKSRAQTAKRVANHKGNAKANGKGNAATVTDALPREREDIEKKETSSSNTVGAADAARTDESRGTRLPNDWHLPKPWGEWALAEFPHWTPDVVRLEAEKFADHWRAQSGKAGRKADWLATWRNWCRSDIAQRAHPAPRATSSQQPSAETAHARKMRETVEGLAPGVARRRPGPATPVTIDLETPHVPAIASH